MGADGGICWLKLKNSSKYERVIQLLEPFWFLTNIDDYHWSNVEWSNPIICGPQFIIGTYGTDQEYSLQDLKFILDIDDLDHKDNPFFIYENLTFLELVADLRTRPLTNDFSKKWIYLTDCNFHIKKYSYLRDPNGNILSDFEKMLWYICEYNSSEIEDRDDLKNIADMKVGNWVKELRSSLNLESLGFEETWT